MSFFAGNGKLHITSTERNITELDTNNIYPDTVFHSNMQSLCSLGEYQAQSAAVGFYVNGFYEECFEAAIPAEVQAALLDNKVVLVIMGNIQITQGNQTPYETLLGLPINIKVGTGAGTSSNDITYSVAVSPQVTAGGMLDVSYSVNSINNKTITVVGKDEWGTTGSSFAPSSRVIGWSTDPDYSVGGKVTNLLRPTSKYVQYHARGLRWKLSNYELRTHNTGDVGVDDNPYLNGVSAILAPKFTFIVLNARFVNGSYQFINPLTQANNDGIVMQGNNITIKGSKINSIKILQSKNIYAQGPFIMGQALNRIPPGLSVTNASIYSDTARQYKQWAMVNFMQGAKHSNGTLAFMPNPGACEQLLILRENNNFNYSMVDNPYTAHVCPADEQWQWYNIWGYPTPGLYNQHLTAYKRRRDTLLFKESTNVKVLGYMSQHDPFALLDTKAFSSLYLTKDGISGEFAGRVLPIWNTQSPATHMMLGTKNLTLSSTNITRSDLLSNNLVSVEIPGDSVYMGFDKAEENILLGVKATNTNVGTNFHLPGGPNGYNDNMCITFEVSNLSWMYTGDGVIHSLHKLFDGEEITIAQSYMQGSVKVKDYQGGANSGTNQAMILQTIGIHILYCLRREGNSLRRYTRAMVNADIYTKFWGASLKAIDWSLSTINIPSVSAYVVRIQ